MHTNTKGKHLNRKPHNKNGNDFSTTILDKNAKSTQN